MSDETTELPCPFCGGEASWIAAQQREDGTYYPAACGCRKCGIWRYGESDYGHGGFATEQDRKVSMEQAISKWNTRATSGTLTAEQVRELIAPHLHAIPTFDFGHHGAVWEADFQAIADEMNATLGAGECEFVIEDNMNESEGMGDVWFRCTNCDTTFDYYADDWLMKQNYCPHCGCKIRKAVER